MPNPICYSVPILRSAFTPPAFLSAIEGGTSSWGAARWLLLAAGAAVGVLTAWWLIRARQSKAAAVRHAPQSHELLFHELCQAHRLTAAQERLLEWVIADRQLALAGLVFLDPLVLERAISRSDNPGVRKRLTDLRTRLFAGLISLGRLPA